MLKIARILLSAMFALSLVRPLSTQNSTGAGDLKAGDILNQTNWKKAEGLLPPEILKHYQNGVYANPIVDWPLGVFKFPPDFAAGSEKNAGQLDVDAIGTIIEKGSGKQPSFILGYPFPIIDPADPKAGTKAVW